MVKLHYFPIQYAVVVVALFLGSCNTPSGGTTVVPAAPTIRPTSVPINSSVDILNEAEIIYDWSTDKCANDTLPDLPVRAFRDAQEMVQLNLSFTRNFRLIGKDFNSLGTDCQVTFASAVDPDPSHYSFKEWMGSTYTFDGQTIYALIHNEWYGREASHWDAQRDFSDEQGFGDWYYQSWNGSEYKDMHYDSSQGHWSGSGRLCQFGRTWVHPDLGCDPTRTWVSEVEASVTVSGSVSDADPGGGNGVVVSILKDDQELWSATIENGDRQGKVYDLQVPVQVGDRIHFKVNARGDTNYDSTVFSPGINLGPAPCPSVCTNTA